VLLVDKPAGPTSHDVVQMARRGFGTSRIGHTGTLDPMATGLLVLAVEQATRLVQFLAGDRKTYVADIRFGLSTDTYDVTGETLATSRARPSADALTTALEGFRGDFAQRPPAYSAKKVGGVRAHALARRDNRVDISLGPVPVSVLAIELVAFDGDLARLEMTVSAGFYVRSLAHDLGQALGMGAALEALRRTAAGAFHVAAAIQAEALRTEPRDVLAARLVPLDSLLPDLPALVLPPQQVDWVRHGRDVPGDAGGTIRLLDGEGHLIALAAPARQPGFLHGAVVLG
jgi:tRNA pseudouridine55 synthase